MTFFELFTASTMTRSFLSNSSINSKVIVQKIRKKCSFQIYEKKAKANVIFHTAQ